MKRLKQEMTLEDELYRIGLIFLVVGAAGVYIALRWIIPNLPETAECMFWKFWGIYCPGCGGTRAVIAFLEGHFLESLWYHPIVMYTAVLFGWFMVSHTLEKIRFPLVRGMKFQVWQMYGALVVIAVNCIIRNILKFGFGILM